MLVAAQGPGCKEDEQRCSHNAAYDDSNEGGRGEGWLWRASCQSAQPWEEGGRASGVGLSSSARQLCCCQEETEEEERRCLELGHLECFVLCLRCVGAGTALERRECQCQPEW